MSPLIGSRRYYQPTRVHPYQCANYNFKMGKRSKHLLADNNKVALNPAQTATKPQIPGLGLENQPPAEDDERYVGQDLLDALEQQISLGSDGSQPSGTPVNSGDSKTKNRNRRARRVKTGKASSAENPAVEAQPVPQNQNGGKEHGGGSFPSAQHVYQRVHGPGPQQPSISNVSPSFGNYYGQQMPSYGLQASAWAPAQALPYRNLQPNPYVPPKPFQMQQNWPDAPAWQQQTAWGATVPQSFGMPLNGMPSAPIYASNALSSEAIFQAINRMEAPIASPAKPQANHQGYLQYRSAPKPTAAYIQQASTKPTPERRQSPQKLFVILDLNGVLLHRQKGQLRAFKPRDDVEPFLEYLFANHDVMVWSSMKPENMSHVCGNLFNDGRREKLVAAWARDKLRLTKQEYNSKTQVYKQLSWVWDAGEIEAKRLEMGSGVWSKANTVLIDDSVFKAAAEPYNLIEVPEFKGKAEKFKDGSILGQVVGYLEELKYASDVSYHMRMRSFKADEGWKYDWPRNRLAN